MSDKNAHDIVLHFVEKSLDGQAVSIFGYITLHQTKQKLEIGYELKSQSLSSVRKLITQTSSASFSVSPSIVEKSIKPLPDLIASNTPYLQNST